MKSGRRRSGERLAAEPPRIGLFGLLGAGNLGNDASFEVVLNAMRSRHPDAIFDAMCTGPEQLIKHYRVESVQLLRYKAYRRQKTRASSVVVRAFGKMVEAVETLRWVRGHDAVIVPGAGMLEATLPVQPWGTPYALLLLCAAGRILGTKVALVNVGANVMNQRLTRWVQNTAAKLAFYRSYRDELSREAMRQRGLDVSRDEVGPDLVFGLGALSRGGDPRAVGLGVMEYWGTNDDRRHAAELRAGYIEEMTSFVAWLLDEGRAVRLLLGDISGCDDCVAHEITTAVSALRPELAVSMLTTGSLARPSDLLEEMDRVGTVIATRYHNVVSALSLAKPTISIGYSAKHDVVMADMGVQAFCQSIRSLDHRRLAEQFLELERRAPEVRRVLETRGSAKRRLLEEQFDRLSALLFPREAPDWRGVDRRRDEAGVA